MLDQIVQMQAHIYVPRRIQSPRGIHSIAQSSQVLVQCHLDFDRAQNALYVGHWSSKGNGVSHALMH